MIGHTLTNYIENIQQNEEDTARIMKTVTLSLINIHKKGKIHRNINPDNIIIIGKEGERTGEILYSNNGSFDFCAPEMINLYHNNAIGTAADKFSLGCCLFYAFTGYNPFDRDNSTIEQNILDKSFEINYQTINYVEKLSEYRKFFFKNVIMSLLKPDPNDRAPLEIIVQNPLFWDNKNKIKDILKNFCLNINKKEIFDKLNSKYDAKYEVFIQILNEDVADYLNKRESSTLFKYINDDVSISKTFNI